MIAAAIGKIKGPANRAGNVIIGHIPNLGQREGAGIVAVQIDNAGVRAGKGDLPLGPNRPIADCRRTEIVKITGQQFANALAQIDATEHVVALVIAEAGNIVTKQRIGNFCDQCCIAGDAARTAGGGQNGGAQFFIGVIAVQLAVAVTVGAWFTSMASTETPRPSANSLAASSRARSRLRI